MPTPVQGVPRSRPPTGSSAHTIPRRQTAPPAGGTEVASEQVGRASELEEMRSALSAAIDFQAPQLITVIGARGTGKTRLISELLKSATPQTRVVRAESEKDGGRYSTIASLLRSRFGINGVTSGDGRPAFEKQVCDVFGGERVPEVLHFLGEFLGFGYPDSPFIRVLGDNPVQHDAILRTVLRRFLELDAARSPLVLVFDELQWVDDDSLAMLEQLGSGLGGSPVVLIASARPELLVRFSGWNDSETDHLRIDLRNLDSDDAEAMFANLLVKCDTIPEEVMEDAVEVTGGNPAFLEELVRLFLKNGSLDTSGPHWRIDIDRALETELPIGVEEAIAARIAALNRPERDILEKGAVFGNVFWSGAVVALTRLDANKAKEGSQGRHSVDWSAKGDEIGREVQSIISELVERDYLLELDAEDSTISGDSELVFKHNLERELISKSTAGFRLERYHRLAAQWLESKLSARSEEQLEFLAQLYERGGDERRAAHCFLAAADKASSRYANEQAVELYERGLGMLDKDEAVSRLTALHNLGSVLDRIGRVEEAAARFDEMLRWSWLFDHKAKGGAAHGRLGRIDRAHGEYDHAMSHFRTARELFQQSFDQRGISGSLDDMGKVHWLRGAYKQALEYHRQALTIRRAIGDRRSIALSLANIGRVHKDSGGFKAATRQFREALDLRRDIGDMSGVVESLCDIGGVHVADGAYEMAMEMFREAHQIAAEIGDKLALTEVLSRLGECKSAMGRGSEAVEHLLEAIALAKVLGERVEQSECSRRLAVVYLTIGKLDDSLAAAEEALSISEDVGSRVHIGTAHRVLAEVIAARKGGPEQIELADDHFQAAVDVLAGIKNELEMARCYRSFAQFKERTGRGADAAKLSQRAEQIFGRLRGAASVE